MSDTTGMVRNATDIIEDNLATATTPCVTASFQADCVILVHLLRKINRSIPVLFLDTVHHFDETYTYRDEIAARWHLNLVNLRAVEPSPGLWRTSTDACCAHHKVAPLFTALEGHDVWFTALRREQSPTRAHLSELEVFKLPTGNSLRKVSPLAGWTMEDVLAYARTNAIPLLPLYDRGYASIGCEPCTSLPVDLSNPRSGRWRGQKLECGIHLQDKEATGNRN